MNAAKLTEQIRREQLEAKMADDKARAETLKTDTRELAASWRGMWEEMTGQSHMPEEVAKGVITCFVNHSLIASSNSNMADKARMMMERVHELKRESNEYPDKEF